MFVYLSSHEPDAGGATKFSHLQLPTAEAAEELKALTNATAAATLVTALTAALVAAEGVNSTTTAAMLVTALAEATAEAARTTRLAQLATAATATAAAAVAPPVRVAPIAGSAAVWSNVDGDGRADPCLVHEAEALNYPSMVSMDAALADRSLPLKIGLNLWFTVRRRLSPLRARQNTHKTRRFSFRFVLFETCRFDLTPRSKDWPSDSSLTRGASAAVIS